MGIDGGGGVVYVIDWCDSDGDGCGCGCGCDGGFRVGL